MTQLHDIYGFIDRARKAGNPAELNNVMQAITREMGFDNFVLAHYIHLKPDRRTGAMQDYIALSDYTSSWMDLVFEGKFSHNPVRRCSYATNLGFAWERVDRFIPITQADRDTMTSWKGLGVGDGYTVGTHLPGEPSGSCSFTMRPGRTIPHRNLPMAHLIGCFAFQAARELVGRHAGPIEIEPPKLTTRQLECIVLVAKGKTDWEIARILGISEETVKQHLKDARARYDVSKRVQLVIRVVHEGLVSLRELM